MTIKISVIVPALNSEKTIRNCVESLIGQDYPSYEVIVIDNGSTDRTRAILGKCEKICVLDERRQGSYRARNKGLNIVKGHIIAFTDSDCIADRNWLSSITRNFKNKSVKVVAGPVRSISNRSPIQRYCDQFCHISHRSLFTTSNMAVRKNVLVDAGGFNIDLISGGDFELCSRIIHSPNEAIFDTRAIVYHAYSNKQYDFMVRFFKYGRGIGKIQRKLEKRFETSGIGYVEMFKEHGSRFTYYKIIQDISYRFGMLLG